MERSALSLVVRAAHSTRDYRNSRQRATAGLAPISSIGCYNLHELHIFAFVFVFVRAFLPSRQELLLSTFSQSDTELNRHHAVVCIKVDARTVPWPRIYADRGVSEKSRLGRFLSV